MTETKKSSLQLVRDLIDRAYAAMDRELYAVFDKLEAEWLKSQETSGPTPPNAK